MKIKQQPSQFRPITITLETVEEAEEFISIVDHHASPLARKLSNRLSDGDIYIPVTDQDNYALGA